MALCDLRRTAGSLLVDAGVHLEQVADLLGHADVATTRRHYVHALTSQRPVLNARQRRPAGFLRCDAGHTKTTSDKGRPFRSLEIC